MADVGSAGHKFGGGPNLFCQLQINRFAFSAFNQDISIWNVGASTSFSRMFQNTPFNHDLCLWGTNGFNVSSSVPFSGTFSDTNCPSTASPDLDASPISPLCHVCQDSSPSVSAEPSLSPVPSLTPSGIPSPVPSESPSGPVILTRAHLNAARDDWIGTGTSVSLDYPTISIYHYHAKE